MVKFILYAIAVLFTAVPLVCYADTAEVLPKKVFDVGTTYFHYFDIYKRYNQDGKPEDLAKDFNTNLTSKEFPDLTQLDHLMGSSNICGSLSDFSLMYR